MKKYFILPFVLFMFSGILAANIPSQPAGIVISTEVTDFWTSKFIENSKQHLSFMGGVYYNLTDEVTLISVYNYGLNKVISDSVAQNATTGEAKFGLLYDICKIGRVTIAIGGEIGGSFLDLSQDNRGAISAFTKAGMLAFKTSMGPGEGILYGRISHAENYTKGFMGIGYAVPLALNK